MSMSNTMRPPQKVTVVEEGTEFRGTLTSSCPIDVRGRVEGELATPALTVSASGAVHGRAKVGEVRSLGEISGEFDADKIELAGVVRDNTVIRARSLDVKIASERGKLQIIFGECELSVGDEPRENDHVVEPAAAVVEAPPAAVEAVVAPPPSMEQAAAVMGVQPASEEDEADNDEPNEVAEAGSGGKRKRRRKNGQEEPATGWSQPPSQPPPAN
jgi:cytoskeletal protein CcmA (bactofilin family)